MPEVLVTGGAGFIGSHLVDALLDEGAGVVVLDDLSTGRSDNLRRHPRMTFIEGDIRDGVVLDRIAANHQIVTVFHLAAVASVARSVEDPLETMSVNAAGSVRLALWAARSFPDPARFVFASSAAVYGSEVPVPTPEDVTGAPDSPYGLEKATVERYLAWMHRHHGLPSVSARFFNVFGPRQDPSSPYSGVLSLLAGAARDGTPFTLQGDGGQSRDFVFVADIVSALLLLARRPRAVGGAFNVGTGQASTLNTVIETFEEVAGRSLQLCHGPERPGDIRHSAADASALHALGWSPTWSLREGLRALLQVN